MLSSIGLRASKRSSGIPRPFIVSIKYGFDNSKGGA